MPPRLSENELNSSEAMKKLVVENSGQIVSSVLASILQQAVEQMRMRT